MKISKVCVNNEKKIAIALIVFFIILIVVLIVFYPTKENEKQLTNKEIIEQIFDGYVSGISQNELNQLMNQDIDEKTMMTRKDAYVLSTPKKEIVEQYKLENYINKNEQYYKNLESQIEKNYEWSFNGWQKVIKHNMSLVLRHIIMAYIYRT